MRTETATAIRDRAARRVRRITAFAIAGATALTAAFTGIAAGSTHTKSTAKRATTATTTTQKTVTAPVPSLSSSGATVTPQTQTQAQPQPQVVTPTAQPPVAVTGGS